MSDAPNVVVGIFDGAPYLQPSEFAEAVGRVVDDFRGRISLAEAIGALRLVEAALISGAMGADS